LFELFVGHRGRVSSSYSGLDGVSKISRAGSKAFIVQWCVIKFKRYLAIIEYGGGGWRGFVVILGGRGGRGSAGFVLEL
jgi:hypothetical protein